MGRKKENITFDSFYSFYFPGRWEALKEALLKEPVKEAYENGLLKPYFLDEASVFTAMALDVQEGENILDLCAAPGGKTLILAGQIGETGHITANDRSSARRSRLRNVINEHLPKETAARLTVTGHDAAKWCLYEKDAYDRILLDAPCSSERHVLTSPPHLAKWGKARTKHLSIQAFSMLASALDVVKTGGTIVYSTCALSPLENDGVIQKLEKKRAGRFRIVPVDIPYGEKTEYGWQILPDTSNGKGPMYISKIIRIK